MPWTKRGQSRAERVVAFLEFLPITKGPLAGKRMKLLDDQREFVNAIYGELGPDGKRIRRIGVKSQPKGGGKTGLCAGLVLCHLLGPESEARGEVYSAAIDRNQASIIFRECEAIILEVPEFAERVNITRFHKRIEVLDGDGKGSTYDAMSAEAKSAHGLAPSLFVYDELAQAPDRELLDALINGLGKRAEALGLIISTQAPDDEHPLSQIIDDGLTGADPSIFVQLLAAPFDADPFDEATWRACNPALDKFLSLQEFREAANRARRMPAFEAGFRNLRLNQRVEASEENRLVTAPVWKRGDIGVDRAKLAGRICYAGLDLSAKHDLTTCVLVFPSDDDPAVFDVLPFFWTPEEQLNVRSQSEQERFRLWIKQGHMATTPGPTVRYDFVAAEITRLAKEFDLRLIAYDAWRIDTFKADLEKVETHFPVPLEPFGQGYKSMAPAIDWFAELALTDRIRHGAQPVLTACVANAVVTPNPDGSGNLKINKTRSNRRGPVRIDGAVALVMALAVAKGVEPTGDVNDFIANMVFA